MACSQVLGLSNWLVVVYVNGNINLFNALCTSLGHMLHLTRCYNQLCQFSHKHAILQTQIHHSADRIPDFYALCAQGSADIRGCIIFYVKTLPPSYLRWISISKTFDQCVVFGCPLRSAKIKGDEVKGGSHMT